MSHKFKAACTRWDKKLVPDFLKILTMFILNPSECKESIVKFAMVRKVLMVTLCSRYKEGAQNETQNMKKETSKPAKNKQTKKRREDSLVENMVVVLG